jgi:acetylornithine deacetylase/succinyl-diaminopimelate desuccinylase-like protein
LFVTRNQLQNFEAIVREVIGTAKYADISTFGYGEAQMLNEQQGVNCVYFGPGPDVSHQVDEHVSITELKQVTEVYRRLIEQYCVG